MDSNGYGNVSILLGSLRDEFLYSVNKKGGRIKLSKKDESTNLDIPANENTEKQEKKKENITENIIYLGPDIPNIISSSTVFEG